MKSELINAKVPSDVAAAARRAAKADDRSLSSYVRRLIIAAVRSREPEAARASPNETERLEARED